MLRTPRQLDTVLRIRRRQEDLKALDLAEARRVEQAARDQRQRLINLQREAIEAGAARAKGEFDARDVRRYYQYERHVARLGVEKDAEIHGLEVETEKRRKELEEAVKRRRMMERLREKRQTAWQAELNKAEQILLDETATNYAAMKTDAWTPEQKDPEAR